MSDTKIQWTDTTWNPVTGCDRVSPGCGTETEGGCYAERMASRLAHHPAYEGVVENGRWTGRINCVSERLGDPLRWRKPRRVFVNSMSDLFHPDVPVEFMLRVFDVMARTPQHTYQILTKRPQTMARVLADAAFWKYIAEVAPPNVWLGTSIENDRYAFRANHLRTTPAAVRFISAEPLLGPLPSLDLTGIDWLIVGGESGPRSRPMELAWVRDLRDRCAEAGVAFFVKQLGVVTGGKTHHDIESFPADLRIREWPA